MEVFSYHDLDFLEKIKINCKEILENKNYKVSKLLIDIFYKKRILLIFIHPSVQRNYSGRNDCFDSIVNICV